VGVAFLFHGRKFLGKQGDNLRVEKAGA